MDSEQLFGSMVGNEFEVMLRANTPHKPELARKVVCIHSLTIYIDLLEDNSVGNIKTYLLRCVLFVANLKVGKIITTGEDMNNQTFGKLLVTPLLNVCFQFIHTDLGDTRVQKTPPIYQHHFFVVKKNVQHILLTKQTLKGGCFKKSRDSNE